MSEPDIYTIKLTGYPEDHYVLWRDYEKLKDYHKNYVVGLVERMASCKADADRLKAEVERLRASSFLTAVPVEQYERLRKAGDELLDGWIGMYGDHKGSMAQDYIKLWNAAKEGKPSV